MSLVATWLMARKHIETWSASGKSRYSPRLRLRKISAASMSR